MMWSLTAKNLRNQEDRPWGTLDPDVVGGPIAVGKVTRMVEFMQDEGKIYEEKSLWDFLPRRRMPAVKS